jgi:tetratricopeptide (TPR) repeat protein
VWSLRILAAGYEPLRTAMRVSAVRAVLSTDYQLRKLDAPRPGPLGGLDVKTVQAELAAADRLLQAGEADEAIRAYRTLLTRIPTLTTLNLRIGAAFRLEGDDDAAVAAYQAAIDAGAAPAKAHLRIAEIAVDRGDAATARVHLEQVLSLAPASDQAAEARALLERVQSGR